MFPRPTTRRGPALQPPPRRRQQSGLRPNHPQKANKTHSCPLRAKRGHSCYRETERDRQPRLNRGIKFLTAAGCDLTATRAAALDLQQADELARVFAKSNTKRPTGSADLVRSLDTSRSSR